MKLSDVLATDLLSTRPASPVLPVLAPEEISDNALQDTTRRCCERAMRACGADTAGISIFNHSSYNELTWTIVVGAGQSFEGRRYPLRHSMCGVCFDSEAPQLFIEAQRYFQWLDLAGIRVAEGLVVPLRTPDGTLYGTIWLVAHGDAKQFSAADVQVMRSIEEELYKLISQDTIGIPGQFMAQAPADKAFKGERRIPKTSCDNDDLA